MSKAKRTLQQAEAVTPPKLHTDPVYMIALRSSSGRVHLVDRNCALVSRRCRRMMEAMERRVLYDGDSNDSHEASAPAHSDTPHVNFYRISVDGDADSVVSVPLTVLYEAYQQRLAIAADRHSAQSQPIRADAPRASSGNQSRRGGGTPSGPQAAVPAASTPGVQWPPAFATLDTSLSPADGDSVAPSALYPLLDLPDVPDALLDVALDFMHTKYRTDTDTTEKRESSGAPLMLHEGHNLEQLAAASVILEL